jgi:GntR family transcriptional repressor for pyruvate dehydrogenase complex
MMTETRLRRPDRLADVISGDLASAIGDGRYSPGERLPTEAEMAAQYGVSRAVVREAIAQLKADGLVAVRQGAGAYVTQVPGAASFKIARGSEASNLRHLFELRLVVEGAATTLAAKRRSPEELATLERSLANMRAALAAGHDGSGEDGLFHEAIAKASQNPELARFVRFLGHSFSQTRAPSWTALGRRRRLAEKAVDEHQTIFDAIAAGDSEGAHRASDLHIRNSEERTLLALR